MYFAVNLWLGLPFADEHHRALALFLLLIEMIFAVFQLRDTQRDGLGAFARELLDLLQFLPQLLRVRNLRRDVLGKLFPAHATGAIVRATTFDQKPVCESSLQVGVTRTTCAGRAANLK